MLNFTLVPILSGKSSKAGKTKYIILTCFMIFLLADFSFANINQGNWRWRNDDGDVYTATWKDSLNTPLILNGSENIRLRIQTTNWEDWDSSYISLRYTEDGYGWTKINGIDTGKFFISPSIYLSDEQSFFDNQLLPTGGDTYNKYRRTVTFDSTNNYFLRGEDSSLYELEYSIKPTLKIDPGSAYFFSLFVDRDSIPMYGSGGIDYAVLMTPPISWVSQSFETGYNISYFQDIFFIDNNTGFAVGYGLTQDFINFGLILKTTNGGANWSQQTCPADVSELIAVYFVNTDIGVAVGDSGVILRTTNGGTTWLKQNSNITSYLWDVYFINADSGTAISGEWINGDTHISYILRTTNGGTTWTKQSYPNKFLNAVCFTDLNTGTIVGSEAVSDEAIILRTTNGGESWFNQSSGTSGYLYDVFFIDANNGTAVGWDLEIQGSLVLKTTNGGTTWWKSFDASGWSLSSVYFADNNTGWAAGGFGTILKTNDGGLSWKKLTSGTSQDLGTVQFVNSEIGWAVGGNKILKTTNGGITTFIEEEKTDFIPEGFYLSQNYPNPFNPSTSIEYRVGSIENVILKIYDVLGNEIATLVNEEKQTGTYEATWNAEGLSSGVYFYQLRAGDFTATKKLLLLK